MEMVADGEATTAEGAGDDVWLAAGGPNEGGGGGPNEGGGDGGDAGTEGDSLVETERKVDRPRRYKVIFHNDDFTTMEFVVEVLRRFFHKNESEAVHVMLTVHKKGKAAAGIYTRDVAETKVTEVMKTARERGMPLLLTTEPE